MPWVNGQILTEDGFRKGSLEFGEDGIKDITGQRSKEALAEGLVLPLFVNAHTHIGDSFIKEELEGSMEEIMAPPNGLKHRLLENATDDKILGGMRESIERMNDSGISHFIDFREGGLRGASLLFRAALDYSVTPIVFGRPSGMEYDKKEVESLLRSVDGLGISSISDYEMSVLEKLRRDAESSGKGFAFHASERIREDIDAILDLNPDFLVHMLEATDADLERCSDAGVPIVVCPRANAFFGKAPRLGTMLDKGVTLMLGTDNAMLSSPSIFEEMRFIRQMSEQIEKLTSGSILRMALKSRKTLNGQSALSLQIGQPSEFLVLELSCDDPEDCVVARASERDISLVARGKRLWIRRGERLKEESNWLERRQESRT
ncbi:MAG: amidohydrolase family protein [Methanobacteriota archaeon]|nr:MAG: amidohydrolase family protein [Euryarchaeota archaeon]